MNTEQDNRNFENRQPNDRLTEMTDQEKIQEKLEKDGFTEQFRVEKDRLCSIESKKKYKSSEVKVVNFYRFEGSSDPDNMSILYAIETNDGARGTLTDAYGTYSDDETGAFIKEVETHKKTD